MAWLVSAVIVEVLGIPNNEQEQKDLRTMPLLAPSTLTAA